MNDIELKVASEGLEVAKGFLQKLINPSIEEIGLLVADNIRLWRYKNQLRIIHKAETYIRENNIEIKQIPVKILIPLLEGASLEEDNSLRDRWAALLVNYADSSNDMSTTIFPDILIQLSPKDAIMLDFMYKNKRYDFIDFMPIGNELGLNMANIYNLKRLGLIDLLRDLYTEEPYFEDNGETFRQEIFDDGIAEMYITELGNMFVEACNL